MNIALEPLCVSLESLSAAVLAGWAGDMPFTQQWGWNCAALTRHDLAELPQSLAIQIREAGNEILDEQQLVRLNSFVGQINLLQTQVVPQLYSGQAAAAVPAYTSTLASMKFTIETAFGWQPIKDLKLMPPQLARKIRALQAEMDQIVPNSKELKDQIRVIREATEAADALPTDLQALSEARRSMELGIERLTQIEKDAGGHLKVATEHAQNAQSRVAEVDKIVEKCEDAYRITTTKGLAAAFDERAKSLSKSLEVWVIGLLIALVVGALLGAKRLEVLSTLFSSGDPKWGVASMHMVLSVISVGAPLWFAWLSTKQIGQRFKLSEDYAFKASVAKAYEGYRREAARIDVALEARLFSSALSRLEEAPLRLVEGDSHGSPWHELVNSDAFKNAISVVPGLKDKFVEVAKKIPGTTKGADAGKD
jgi:hypothetical protein